MEMGPMDTPVTKSDLWDLRDSLGRTLKEGFTGVYSRQDATNGRVRQGEIISAEHSIRLKNLERELFPEGGRRKDDPPGRPPDHTSYERDVKIVMATLAAAASAILFFWKLVPLMARSIAP
jgi:hypothetical protein